MTARTTKVGGAAMLLAMACGGDDAASGAGDSTDAGDTSGRDPDEGSTSSSNASVDDSTSAETTGGTTDGGTTTSGASEDSTGGTTGGTTDGGTTGSSSDTGMLACDVDEPLTAIPMLARAELVNDQGFEGSCSVPGSPEAVFVFTAPADDTYHFDVLTLNSVANAVLYVLDDACAGVEIDCDAAAYYASSYAAVVSVEMDAGDTVTLVAESLGDNPLFQPIDEVEIAVMAGSACPAADLGSVVPQGTVGSLAGVPNTYVPACIDDSSAHDAGFLFTAPEAGGYRFTAAETDGAFALPMFATTGDCGGEQIACSATLYADGDPLTLRMAEGETAAVFVTQNGTYSDVHFTLDVEAVDVPTCPVAEAIGALPQTVSSSTLGSGNDYAPSCGGSFGEEAEITFTAPEAGTYLFAPDSFEIFPVMAVLDGTCSGAELGCVDPTDYAHQPGIAVDLDADQAVTVIVDDALGMYGDFDLLVDRFTGDCIDEDVGTLATPFQIVGSTAGATNSTTGSCAGLVASDYGVAWTAPAAGDYAISTVGSSYMSTISVRDAGCDGAELACGRHDYYGASGTIVNVSLQAGQTVVMIVEGYQAESGDFVLQVEEQAPPGDCCDVTYDAGCSNALIEACVCTGDDFCCNSWDSYCVDIAVEACATDCS